MCQVIKNKSYFTDEVDVGFQCFGSLFPLGRTYHVGMRSHEQGCFDLAEEFVGITPDVVVLHLGNLHLASGLTTNVPR